MIKKKHLVISAILIIVLLDQFTKFLVREKFTLNESVPIIKGIFNLTFITNTGSAFGFFQGINYVFIVLYFIVIFAICHYLKEAGEKEKLEQLAFALVLGGALGNLIDRIAHGYV